MNALVAVAAAIGLAACAGMRAVFPLLAMGLAARLLDWPLPVSLTWLAANPALAILGVAALVEVACDKLPATHRVFDPTETVLAPVTGYLAAFAPMAAFRIPYLFIVALALVIGLGVAGGMHILAASARIASRRTPGGLGTPFLSIAEDLFAGSAAVFAIAAPLLSLVAVLVPAALWLRRLRRDAAQVDVGPPLALMGDDLP
jgi:hypothetical protein